MARFARGRNPRGASPGCGVVQNVMNSDTMTTNIEINKRVAVAVLLAAVLIAATTTLRAAGKDDSPSTILLGQNPATNAAAAAATSGAVKTPLASEECPGMTIAQTTDSLTNISFNTEAFSAVVCCAEPKTMRNSFAFRENELTKTPRSLSARKTVRFFGDGVISVGKSSDSAEWRDYAPETWNRFRYGGSLAGGDAAAAREPRGLRLFSWKW